MTPVKDSLSKILPGIADLLSEAHEKNQAKFALSALAVARLATDGIYTRKTLLDEHPDHPQEGKSVQVMVKQVDWFRKFLKRLEDQEFIRELHDGTSVEFQATPGRSADLWQIANNAVFGDGIEIKRRLFPGDYPEPDPDYNPFADEGPARPDPDPAQEEDDGIDVIREVSKNLTIVTEHLENIYGGLKALGDYLKGTSERLDQAMAKVSTDMQGIERRLDQKLASLDKLENLSGQFGVVLKALKDDRRAQLRMLVDRTTELHSRRNSLLNQMGSEDRKHEKLIEDLNALIASEGST